MIDFSELEHVGYEDWSNGRLRTIHDVEVVSGPQDYWDAEDYEVYQTLDRQPFKALSSKRRRSVKWQRT